MRRSLFAFLLVFAFFFTMAAPAEESPVGKWKGKAKAMGMSFPCSATFHENGSVTLRSEGYSVKGSWSGNTIKIKTSSKTVKLHFSIDGNNMSMSGSYEGISGHASLLSTTDRTAGSRTLYNAWVDEAGNSVSFYQSGYCLCARPTEEETLYEIYSITVEDEQITLTELTEAVEGEEILPSVRTVLYEMQDDALTLSCEDTTYTFAFNMATDIKPESDLFAPFVTLEKGDKGEAVKLLQTRLTQLQYLNDTIDGIYGSKTEEAVKAFETANAIAADGIADPEVRKLLSAMFQETTKTDWENTHA